jgi:hypothetical protein
LQTDTTDCDPDSNADPDLFGFLLPFSRQIPAISLKGLMAQNGRAASLPPAHFMVRQAA